MMALLWIYIAQAIMVQYMPVFWLRIAISLLCSLTVIRFVARVLSKSFPQSTGMRLIERVFSWMVWGLAVLHSLGLLGLHLLLLLDLLHLHLKLLPLEPQRVVDILKTRILAGVLNTKEVLKNVTYEHVLVDEPTPLRV